ncbi:MAG: ASKHA domain-containing protein [Candidatus Methanomethylophilaceae archaeon]
MVTFSVKFMPDDKVVEVEEGTRISEAAVMAGAKMSFPCGGRGRCGKCMVIIGERCGERVLACQTAVEGDTTVIIPSGDRSKVIASTDHRKVKLDDITPLTSGYGLAIDIGTTTVALDLVDLDKGIEVYNAADINLQRSRGEDVLSRMQYAEEGGTEELRSLVLDTINDLIDSYEGSGFSKKMITSVYVAGNTVMTHLFLGVDPSPIREAPYEPIVKKSTITGADSGLDVNATAKIICMPCVSSYVGGDITSDIVYSGMDRSDGLSLLIDIGTNGEVALGNKEMMIACSSSAGPAFEGSNMTSGMLARSGAIDSVWIVDGKINYTTIGDTDPRGICGSGIIDLLAQLFKSGFIDRRGNFTEKANISDGTLTIAEGVMITQDEIKNIILTKAAIYSATRSLMKNLGVEFSDIEKIHIAGGFGNFIDMESAVTIGLFPDVERAKYSYLGNASLAGAKYALLSQKFRERIDLVFERMTYLDLSSDPVFFDEYMSAQFLPHTDKMQFQSVVF